LSRLRKIETITKTEVEAMTIHYDIETDGLYLEGIEKGREEGREEGRAVEATAKEREFTLKLWELQEFSLEKIAMLVGVTQQQVTDTIVNHLTETGNTKEEALAIVENYRP
jgi:predicted transposase YdaD